MARGKIYPHSLVVADKYSAGYCQVKLDSTAVSIVVYIYWLKHYICICQFNQYIYKYSAGYCQVKLDSTVVSIFAYIYWLKQCICICQFNQYIYKYSAG